MHGAGDVVPLLRGCPQNDIEIGLAVGPYQFARGIGVLCVAEQQHDFVLAVGWQFDVGLQRAAGVEPRAGARSEEHTSELQSLMRISYAVFCLKKKISIHSSHYNIYRYTNKIKTPHTQHSTHTHLSTTHT